MLLDEKEAIERFESPLNLLNRLKSNLSKKTAIVSIPPRSSEIVENLEEKLKAAGLKTKAAVIMGECLDQLRNKVAEVDKPSQLAQVAETMNKIITAENKNKKDDDTNKPQFVVYSPTFINEDHFETIYVKE